MQSIKTPHSDVVGVAVALAKEGNGSAVVQIEDTSVICGCQPMALNDTPLKHVCPK